MNKLNEVKRLIGNTPLIEVSYSYKGKVKTVLAKLEWYNLSGSIKDRPAYEIIKTAYEKGELKEGQTICETTSGNMGISISAIARLINNPVVICMPKFMSEERKELLKLYGAKLELTENFIEAFKKAEEYKKNGAYLTYQFENDNNPKAHFNGTAKEIFSKLKDIPYFVSGVGTGGTLMGIGSFLKSKLGTKIVALDPKEASLLTFGRSMGKHKIQGLSDEIIPEIYDRSLVDSIIQISSDDAVCMAQKLCKELGLGVGISSGANFLACVLTGDRAVTVFADDNKKYLSTDLSGNVKSDLVDEIKLIGYKVL